MPGWLERARVLSACGIEFKRGCYARYLEFIEHRMAGEQFSDDVEALVGRQLLRGWFVGGEEFRKWLAEQLPSESDNLRGEQRRAHNEYEAERLFKRALCVLNLSEDVFLSLKSNSLEKQSVVWLLKTHTTVTGVWLAGRLNMGDRSNVSRALRLMRQSRDRRVVTMKHKMTQCTG